MAGHEYRTGAGHGPHREMRAAMVVTEEAGKIVRLRHYIDVAGMMTQLGVAPGGQTAAPP